MTWIADVAPYDTIQSLWGNNVRNRVVQTFDNVAERDSHAASLPIGAMAYTAAEAMLWVKQTGAPTWRPLFPSATRVTGLAYSSVAVGATVTLASLNVGASGYRGAQINWCGLVDGPGTRQLEGTLTLRIFTHGGAIVAHGGWTWTMGPSGSGGNALPVQCNLSCYAPINPAGPEDITVQLENNGNAGGLAGPVRTYADTSQTLSVVYFP